MWSLRSNVILALLEMCRYAECGGFASLAEGPSHCDRKEHTFNQRLHIQKFFATFAKIFDNDSFDDRLRQSRANF